MNAFMATYQNYFWLSFLSGFVVFFVLFFLWLILCLVTAGFGPPRKHWPLIPLVACILLVTPITTILLAKLQIFPPQSWDTYTQAKQSERRAALIENQTNRLRKVLENPRSLSVAQIEEALRQSVELSQEVSTELKNRESLIVKLRQNIRQERAKAEKAARLTKEMQGIKKIQLEAIKGLITEDAKAASRSSFLVSFPMGVVTSLLASWILRRWKVKEYITEGFSRSDRAKSRRRK
jgi:hypothetical protein